MLLGNGDGTFQPQVTYAVGSEPDAIVAGDFTGDGRIDLAVADNAFGVDNTVSVLLGNGDGTFQPQVTYAAGERPVAIVAGDFTQRRPHRPGRRKLGRKAATYRVSAAGQRRRHVPDAGHQRGGAYPRAIVAGDFTGDGRTDLAVANFDDNTVSVLLGNGDGTFQPQVTYAVGAEPRRIVAGDFNGDGRTDLAVANWTATTPCRCCWATATAPSSPRSPTRWGRPRRDRGG